MGVIFYENETELYRLDVKKRVVLLGTRGTKLKYADSVTHRQRVVAERLIIQLVHAKIQCVQVGQARENIWSEVSDVVYCRDKSGGKTYDLGSYREESLELELATIRNNHYNH